MGRNKVSILIIIILFLVCGCKQAEDFTPAEVEDVNGRKPDSFVPFSTNSIELNGPSSTDPTLAMNAQALMGSQIVNEYSISFWFKMKTDPTKTFGGYIRSNFDTENFFAIGWQSNSNQLGYVSTFAKFGPSETVTINTVIPDLNSWNHVVFTYKHDAGAVPTANTFRVFLNGQLSSEQISTGQPIEFILSRKIEILPNGYNMASSYLDEMAFWRRELSGEDAATLYGQGAPGDLDTSITDYTAWWRMGENDVLPTITDETGNFDFDFQFLPSISNEYSVLIIPESDPFSGVNSSDPLNGDEDGDGTTGGSGGSDPLGGGSGGFGGELGDGGSGGNFP